MITFNCVIQYLVIYNVYNLSTSRVVIPLANRTLCTCTTPKQAWIFYPLKVITMFTLILRSPDYKLGVQTKKQNQTKRKNKIKT